MTCQWCIHYRYKKSSVCTWQGRADGKIIPAKEHVECQGFEPRRNCSTCEHRCDYADRESSGGSYGECDRWALRKLSTWGGTRKRVGRPRKTSTTTTTPASTISGSPGKTETQTSKQGEAQ